MKEGPSRSPPHTEEFYISDQVWEYEDFGDGAGKPQPMDKKRAPLSPTFIADDDDDFRFHPTSTDDLDLLESERRRSDVSLSSSPRLAPSDFLFQPLAPPTKSRRHEDEDSDSDCEELRHVLEESRAQLQVTDVTLGKIKRDMIEKGSFLEPSKYKELLATCQTNIKCLQVIHQHLKTPNQTSIPDDVGEIEEIIERWEVLQAVTADKQSRCRALKDLSAKLMSVVEFRDEAAALLAAKCRVDGVAQLDAYIFDLRNCFFGIAEHRVVLQQTRDGLTEFADSNPRYSVQRIRDSVDLVDEELNRLGGDLEQRLAELETVYSHWVEVAEKLREIAFGVRDLRRPGKILRRAATKMSATTPMRGAMAPSEKSSQSEVNVIEDDDRVLKKRAVTLEEDLATVERSVGELRVVTSKVAEEKLSAQMEVLRREIRSLTATQWILNEGVVDESEGSEGEMESSFIMAASSREEDQGTVVYSARMLSRCTKCVVAVFALLALILGLAVLVSPDCCFTRNNLKWSLQPQLRYSDGPPPQ